MFVFIMSFVPKMNDTVEIVKQTGGQDQTCVYTRDFIQLRGFRFSPFCTCIVIVLTGNVIFI